MNAFLTQVNDPSLSPFERLVKIMQILRSPDGCAWDRAQDHRSLLPYLIEETYEVVEAVEDGDSRELREELGDLLCQVVFHAQLGREREAFTMDDVCTSINEKLIRRHPHVFGEQKDLDPQQVRDQWEKNKTESGEKKSVLNGLPKTMPALTMAFRIGEKAGGVGFDWEKPEDVLEKISEEMDEIREELDVDGTPDKERVHEEVGDLLFAVSSLARLLGVEPEDSLRSALAKFRARFERLEATVKGARGKFDNYTLQELEDIWQRIKQGRK